MSILKVARLGHPILRQKAKPVHINDMNSSPIQKLIDDMIETMHEYDGVGLAAPQVHVSLQILIMESLQSDRYPESPAFPQIVMINPEVELLTDEKMDFWEGCLSVPDLRGKVSRCRKIKVKYYDREGKSVTAIAEDFMATVIQHEIDHLHGHVFLDRMDDMTNLSFMQEYQKYWMNKPDIESNESPTN